MTIFKYSKSNSINSFRAPNNFILWLNFGNYFKKNNINIGRINNFLEKEIIINQGNNKSFNHIILEYEGMSIECIKGL